MNQPEGVFEETLSMAQHLSELLRQQGCLVVGMPKMRYFEESDIPHILQHRTDKDWPIGPYYAMSLNLMIPATGLRKETQTSVPEESEKPASNS